LRRYKHPHQRGATVANRRRRSSAVLNITELADATDPDEQHTANRSQSRSVAYFYLLLAGYWQLNYGYFGRNYCFNHQKWTNLFIMVI